MYPWQAWIYLDLYYPLQNILPAVKGVDFAAAILGVSHRFHVRVPS